MYVGILGASTVTVATGAAVLLPNTGTSLFTNFAVSAGVGLVAWGFTYARTHTH
jgi:hypothetical protein